ncbi:hypothetical protein [Clostridium pasteurianum]|uniref:Uncharacterized protein n=1 Tax=Clostridium pasteurianum BC1 TaxID=86416 RepID=R4K7R5_CLOPA|nr:hypothetical protein [Clostridium pasteurianum]AGK98588.1 hypothetical protein Clopa_3827 [Clostridium pasteurianum BC1]
MGTTLANLQIHKLSIDEAEKLLPGSLIKQFNPEWTTITSKKFEVAMEKIQYSW